MLVRTFDKINYEKQKAYLITAGKFLASIYTANRWAQSPALSQTR